MSHPDITIKGRITRDPEIKWTQNGKSYTRLAVATNKYTQNQQGQWEQQGSPLFLNCVAWQNTETIAETVKKGDLVIITGTLEPNNWTDKDGNQRRDTEVKITSLGVIPKGTRQPPQAGNQIGQDPWQVTPQTQATAQGQPQQQPQQGQQRAQPVQQQQPSQQQPQYDPWATQQGTPPQNPQLQQDDPWGQQQLPPF